MNRIYFSSLLVSLCIIASCACNSTEHAVNEQCECFFAADTNWYDSGAAVNDNWVDVFYISSVEVLSSKDSLGNVSYRSVLSPAEKGAIGNEYSFVNGKIFRDSLNFFAPYYHQFTMESLGLPAKQFRTEVFNRVEEEIHQAFDYYMEQLNNGRRFILAGFSQGGMLTLSLLKHMTDEQYSRMVAAYVLGYGISQADLDCKHIVPACDRYSTGVTVSFNSVADASQIWPVVYNGSMACINPVNWRTDTVPAQVSYKGRDLEVAVDSYFNVLVVKGFDPSKDPLPFTAPWPEGCLHNKEIKFYNDCLYRNALDRAYGN